MSRCRRCEAQTKKRKPGLFECPHCGMQGHIDGIPVDRSGKAVLADESPRFQGPHLPLVFRGIRPTLAPAKGAL